MQNRPGEVEQGNERRRGERADSGRDRGVELRPVDGAAGGDGRASLVESVPHRFEHERTAVAADEGRDAVSGEQPVHGGKLGWRRDA